MSGSGWLGPRGAAAAGCAQPGGASLGLGVGYVELRARAIGTAAGIGINPIVTLEKQLLNIIRNLV
jgi:hypothetical protein